jgi:hypothetical protein
MIATGFAAVSLILAIMTGAMEDYAGLVSRSSIFSNIDSQVMQYRGHVHGYVFSETLWHDVDEFLASMRAA